MRIPDFLRWKRKSSVSQHPPPPVEQTGQIDGGIETKVAALPPASKLPSSNAVVNAPTRPKNLARAQTVTPNTNSIKAEKPRAPNMEHERGCSWPDFDEQRRPQLRRTTRTVSDMGPIDGKMFQDYLNHQIANFDGGIDRMRTPSETSMASTAMGFDDLVDQLEITDRLRQFLQSTATPSRLRDLGTFLTIFLNLEKQRDPKATTLEMLRYTRMDKLLEEILQWKIEDHLIFNKQDCTFFRTFVQKVAEDLQLEWQLKFGERYNTLDKARRDNLAVDGALRGVSLNQGHRERIENTWNPMPLNLAAKQFGDLGFVPGDWWLNVQCACRDGIIESPLEPMTVKINTDGVVAIVLDIGKETIGKEPGVYSYIRRGTRGDTLLPLLVQRDRPFRVLRQYSLDSAWAPSAGVRYDGLYILVSFSWICVDDDKDEYELRLGLKRVEDQKPMATVVIISPTPAQLDDWLLYQEILADDYNSRTEARAVYLARKKLEEEELKEKAREEAKSALGRHFEDNKI